MPSCCKPLHKHYQGTRCTDYIISDEYGVLNGDDRARFLEAPVSKLIRVGDKSGLHPKSHHLTE